MSGQLGTATSWEPCVHLNKQTGFNGAEAISLGLG